MMETYEVGDGEANLTLNGRYVGAIGVLVGAEYTVGASEGLPVSLG